MPNTKYDLIVIGAGPAGLMTAKTAADRGLKVLLVELKKDIAENLRLCASVLYIQPGFHGETEHLEDDKIVFVENDFFVRYDGGYHPIWEWCYVSESGHRLRMGKKHYPAAFALDKNVLITKLLEDVEEAGVTLWNETGALKVENTASGVRVLIQKRSEDATWIDASRCVVADGVCSRITQVSFPEVWKKRVRLTGAIGLGYLVENLESDWGDNVFALVKNRYGSAYFVPSPARTAEGNIIWKVIGSSADPINKQDYAQKTMDCMMNEGPLSKFFKNIKVLGRTGTAWDIYTPIYEPAVGNTLLVGDVCSMQEVDIQGALPCGFNAGNAIADELDGKPGFQAYTSWWNKAFEFNVSDDPARELAQGFGLFALGAEVLDYWFSIMEHEVLNSFIDHNQLGALLEGRYRDYRQQMERERPDIVEKLDRYFSISAEEAYQGTTEK